MLNLPQNSQAFLILPAPSDDLQSNRGIDVRLRGIEIPIKPILVILRHIASILDVEPDIHRGDGEDGRCVVEQVPLARVGPVLGVAVGWGCAGPRGAQDGVDDVVVTGAGG